MQVEVDEAEIIERVAALDVGKAEPNNTTAETTRPTTKHAWSP